MRTESVFRRLTVIGSTTLCARVGPSTGPECFEALGDSGRGVQRETNLATPTISIEGAGVFQLKGRVPRDVYDVYGRERGWHRDNHV